MVFTVQRSLRVIVPFVATCALAVVAAAHDDDPKILDHRGPIAGPGFRPAAFLSGGSSSAMAGAVASQIGNQSFITDLEDSHVSFPSSGVELLSWLTLSELNPGTHGGNDCWGYVSPSGREYAIMGLSNGTSFVDLSDPSDPIVLQHIPGEGSLWRDVKIYQHYAYIVSEGGGGIQIVDLAQIDNGIVTLANTYQAGNDDTHNVAIDTDSGFLYRCGGGSGQGLRIYSLSNPVSPNYMGAWNTRYVHDVQVVTYQSGPYAGKQVAFACSGFGNGGTNTGLTVLDVTNKNNITTMDQFYYSNASYSHQAWLSPDRSTLYLNDELDEDGVLPTTTHVMDVTNLNNVQHMGTFTNGNRAIGHNLYAKDDLVYEANYRSGLRVFDVSSAPNATETAYFDTWPGDDTAQFNGLWSCYPYFPSGIVIGSDKERGLFVWWVGSPELDIQLTAAEPTMMSPSGGSVTIQINEQSAGLLQSGSEKLYYDAGNGLVEAPLNAMGPGMYQAQFPAIDCGTTVQWFVGARSTTGILWTLPSQAPYNNFDLEFADAELVAFSDDYESDLGWTVGSPEDTAYSGIWTRLDPMGSGVSPDDDHSPVGTMAYSSALGGNVGGGFTTLTSPVIDLQGWGAPVMSFWLYFRRDGLLQPSDNFRVQYSTDAGSSWIGLDVIGAESDESGGSWMHLSYDLAEFATPTSTCQFRFRVQDGNLNSLVQATVDDFKISQSDCGCQAANYCVAGSNSNGTSASISYSGMPSLAQNNFTLDVTGALPGGLGLFFYGADPTQVPLAEGTLCVSGGVSGVQRLQPPLVLDGSGNGSRYLDLTQAPAQAGSGAIGAGSTYYFQFWYRDPAGGPGGSNLSDGLEVTFCQ